MKRSYRKSAKLSLAAKLSLVASVVLFVAIGITVYTSQTQQEVRSRAYGNAHKPVCPGPVSKGNTRCHARVIVDKNGQPKAQVLPSGYGPVQFLGAYSLSGNVSAASTIAIVDAYDHPNILTDLNNYSKTFNITQMKSCPVSTGTSTSPCFQKVDQRGGTLYPPSDSGWALEIALDVEVAHAVCQNCNILLVEADSPTYDNLLAGVDRGRLMGARVISNSWGSIEFSAETTFGDSHFNYPGIAFTFSSGDSGYGASYPAASQYVTAVGGTTLNMSGNSYLSELAWGGSGSGCSLYESKPFFQTDSGCSMRTVADVSADADPNTGAAVYDSIKYFGRRGWFKVGGTSLASPIVAAVYALSGNTSGAANSIPYTLGNSTNLHDIITGSNGTCSPSYLCNSAAGYDGPTGLGTPKGSGAF